MQDDQSIDGSSSAIAMMPWQEIDQRAYGPPQSLTQDATLEPV